jgi:hypothetical protein
MTRLRFLKSVQSVKSVSELKFLVSFESGAGLTMGAISLGLEINLCDSIHLVMLSDIHQSNQIFLIGFFYKACTSILQEIPL